VALDLELDDELRREGLARELVRSLNDLRKDVGLDIADRVVLAIDADDAVWAAADAHRDYVMNEVLAVELTRAPAGEAHELTVDGHDITVSIDVA
jgi:isoleucyl-tRNA synthetase